MSIPGQEASGIKWRKASLSANDGDCVEVALVDGQIAVRDSRDPDGSWQRYSAMSWRDFISIVKSEGVMRSSQSEI